MWDKIFILIFRNLCIFFQNEIWHHHLEDYSRHTLEVADVYLKLTWIWLCLTEVYIVCLKFSLILLLRYINLKLPFWLKFSVLLGVQLKLRMFTWIIHFIWKFILLTWNLHCLIQLNTIDSFYIVFTSQNIIPSDVWDLQCSLYVLVISRCSLYLVIYLVLDIANV